MPWDNIYKVIPILPIYISQHHFLLFCILNIEGVAGGLSFFLLFWIMRYDIRVVACYSYG